MDNANPSNSGPLANPSSPTPRQGTMRVSAVILTATLTPEHPDYSGPGHQVYCHLCFPSLSDEDENIAKAAELLKDAALRLHHIDQFSISDRPGGPTGELAIDAPMEDIHKLGRHLWISKTPLKIFVAR